MSTDAHSEDRCFSAVNLIENRIGRRRENRDGGFSGVMHAMTGVVAFELLLIVSFAMGWGYQWATLGAATLVIAFGLTLIGGTLIPDLDNTKSTSHSSFGLIGEGLSIIFRTTSVIIQTMIRTSKDSPEANPHRGFWHTLLSAVVLGAGVFLLSTISSPIELPIIGKFTVGGLIALIIFAGMVHLFFSALAKSTMHKIKKSAIVGELLAFLFSAAVAVAIFATIPAQNGYLWLGIGVAAGAAVHMIGDCFTKQGCPLFFPFSVFLKGKMWWYTRFAKLESGGDTEKKILKGMPIVVAALAVLTVVAFFMFRS